MAQLADDVFGQVPDEYGLGASYETILLTGSFEPAAGVAALERAGSRLQMVDERGVEYATFEEVEEASFDDHYTPNYVSDPEIGPKGIQLYVDGKGSIEEPMRARFLQILREELEDLPDAHVRAFIYGVD